MEIPGTIVAPSTAKQHAFHISSAVPEVTELCFSTFSTYGGRTSWMESNVIPCPLYQDATLV